MSEPLSDERLNEIERRMEAMGPASPWNPVPADMRQLVAEIRRLRAAVEAARAEQRSEDAAIARDHDNQPGKTHRNCGAIIADRILTSNPYAPSVPHRRSERGSDVSDDELPKLSDLRGILDLGGKTAVEVVREMRGHNPITRERIERAVDSLAHDTLACSVYSIEAVVAHLCRELGVEP